MDSNLISSETIRSSSFPHTHSHSMHLPLRTVSPKANCSCCERFVSSFSCSRAISWHVTIGTLHVTSKTFALFIPLDGLSVLFGACFFRESNRRTLCVCLVLQSYKNSIWMRTTQFNNPHVAFCWIVVTRAFASLSVAVNRTPCLGSCSVRTRVYPKVSGLASRSENCKWYSFLLLGAVVSLFRESI
jgi:hypothetical protein